MLEKPDIPEDAILECVQANFGIDAERATFLPLGADVNTAVYRVDAREGGAFFLKLRKGELDGTSVALPKFLHDEGIRQVIAPIVTTGGRLWAELGEYAASLYPFVTGRDGYAASLSDGQWIELGVTVRRYQSLALPAPLTQRIPRETYSPAGREAVRGFLERAGREQWADPAARKTAALLAEKRAQIEELVATSERLAGELAARSLPFVLCHTDLHAGNLLIADAGGLYIVDWDAPLLAPKERDLMYPGGGMGFQGHTPAEEEALFYRGYGKAEVDREAIRYYRCEHIVQDIAEFCKQLLQSEAGGADREQAYQWLAANFKEGGTIVSKMHCVQ